VALRNQINPTIKIDIDEMGVILPDDNDYGAPDPPPIYWNAAGGMFAYLFGQLSLLGVEVLGESQLACSPAIPQWDIPDPQYPSVSLLNWTTGAGNARYWVLKLLLDEFEMGDQLVKTQVLGVPSNPMCGVVNGASGGYGNVSFQCAGPTAVISSIDFAAFGTPYGTCGNYSHNASCDAANCTAVVQQMCLGQNYCSVLSYPTFGDPCYGTYKSLIIQARCSDGQGGYATPNASPGPNIPYAQGFITTGAQKDVGSKQK